MNLEKLGKAKRARELARWFRNQLREAETGEFSALMASTAIALEWEAFRLEREAGKRRSSRRPRLVVCRAA